MALIVFLLIAIPAGYIVISAEQSRDSGEGKEAEAAATGLTNAFPSKVQQRIYNVPVPIGSTPVYYYETNSWQTSSLFVQFRTNKWGLEHYLNGRRHQHRRPQEEPEDHPPGQAAKVGWDLSIDVPWAGTTTTGRDAAPVPADHGQLRRAGASGRLHRLDREVLKPRGDRPRTPSRARETTEPCRSIRQGSVVAGYDGPAGPTGRRHHVGTPL